MIPNHLSRQAVDETASAYLGDDLAVIVASAALTGDPVLAALCSATLAKRQAAIERWRASLLTRELNQDAKFRKGYLLLSYDTQLQARTGKVALAEVSSAADAALIEADRLASEARRGSLDKLKAVLRGLHLEPDTAKSRGIPTDLIVLADGSVSFHPNRASAKAHGRSSGQAWFHAAFNREYSKFHTVDPEAVIPGVIPPVIEEAAASDPEEQEPDPVKAVVSESGELLPA
jgi:hypothetical protein